MSMGVEFMDVRILDSVNYEQAALILRESHFPQWGAIGSPDWNANYIEYLDNAYMKPLDSPRVGAFIENELIGIGFGFINNWSVQDLGVISTMNICNLGVLPRYQRKGIATSMVNALVDEASRRKIKAMYRICREDLQDHRVLAKCGFIKKMNNIHHLVRIMGTDMIERLASVKGMNKAMQMVLRIVSGMPKLENGIHAGLIKDVDLNDVRDCVKILNDYEHTTSISRVWSEEEFQSLLSYKDTLRSPFRAFFHAWEVEGTIKAFMTGRKESIRFQNGTGNAAGIIETGFANDLDRKDKTRFIISCLFKLKDSVPDGFGINLVVGHHEKRAFEKAGFTDDRSSRPLYVRMLADYLQEWFRTDWNFKNYYIPYQR
jgi:GNAT superfamily N-acetyltransferase